MNFLGPRQYPTDMLPVSFKGRHQLGLLFRSENRLDGDLSYLPQEISMDAGIPPGRRNLEGYMRHLNMQFAVVQPLAMMDLFDGFPSGPLEEWALEYNHEFILEFNGYYDPAPMHTIIICKALGETNVHWTEYADTYRQALTMEKLSSGL